MTRPPLVASALLLALLAAPAPAQEPSTPNGSPPTIVAHEIAVALDPEAGTIEMSDRMTVRRNGGGDLPLDCRADLVPRAFEVDGRAQEGLPREAEAPRPGFARYRVKVPRGPGETGTVVLGLGGTIREDVEKARDLAFVAGDRSAGTISPAGVFLSDTTGWVPTDGGLATYAVTASLPEGWTAASQGGVPTEKIDGGRTIVSFPAGIPSDGLWLQAGRWKVERRATARGTSVATYLSEGNAANSKLILDSVEEYLGLYEKVLGPYPHAKFDVVENFFSTGYGMPSATLLGGDVVAHMSMMAARSGGRVPAGYLDHELVHGWWGNGVLVDYASGNWCEALTTYCANYLRKEWESAEEAAKHRRGVRARFAARVDAAKDYALRKFTGKTEDLDNDIGYGKGSMAFHQVRRSIGDEAFFAGLRDVAAGFTGKRASWDDFRAAFEKRSGRNLASLFDQVLDRKGAPLLALEGCAAARSGEGWQVTGRVVQRGRPLWHLALPVVVETVRGSESTTLDVGGEATAFSVRTASLPTRVLLDPDSHAWRGFERGERPAMLDGTVHDPAGFEVWVPEGEAGAPFAPVVEAVARRAAAVVRIGGAVLDPPPAPAGTRSILALGNLATDLGLRPLLDAVRVPIRIEGKVLRVNGQRFEGDDIALLASDRHPASRERSFTVYAGMSPAALAAARRVFFYGGDGIVVFKAGRPVLRIEAEGEESSRAGLLDAPFAEADGPRAMRFVEALCAKETDGRLAGSEAGAAAVEILAKALAEDGLQVLRQPVAFDVADWDGSACLGVDGKPAATGGVPFSFSPPVAEWKAPTPLVVDAAATPDGFLSAVRAAQEKGATAILVLGPTEPPPAIADWLLHPSSLPEKEREKLRGQPAALVVEGKRSRLLDPGFEVTVPVVYLGRDPSESWLPAQVRSTTTGRRIETVNLLAVVPGSDPSLAAEGILLGSHHDHLGPGFPGANDNATGMAAVREAGRVLSGLKGSLRRPVVLAFFGAEEWGLRGSRVFAASPPEGLPRIVAALNLDTVGQRGVPLVNVVGESIYPALASAMCRCLAGAGLRRGPDIDRYAFAWGSDHYALHAAGIPAIDLFSAEYRTMHTPGDTTDTVEPEKLVRMARAAAAFALSLSREGPPR